MENDSEEEMRLMKEEIAALEAQLDPTEPPTPKRVLKEQGKTASKQKKSKLSDMTDE